MLNSGDQPAPRRVPQPSSRKGCMRGKGGPENASCWFKGVRQRTWGKWVAEIREPNHGARLWLGTFEDSESAAIAYDKAARRIYGLEAEVNFPDRLSSISPTAATVTTDQVSNIGTTMSHREIQMPETGFIQIPDRGIEMQLQLITPPRDECYSSWYDFCSTNQFILHDKKQEYYDENGLSEFGGSSSCHCIDKVDELCLSTATDGITNYKKSLKVDHLPEVDDSSLWADAIATTDFQKMIDSEFLAVGVEDMALQNKVIDTFWLNKDA